MAIGITVQITHTGLTSSSILINDVFTSVEGPAGFRKAGPVYVPVGGSIELVYTESVARSFEFGAIRSFITTGHVTAVLVTGTSVVAALAVEGFLPGGPGTLSRKFTINNKILDSDAMAAAGIFATDGAAWTWIEANVPIDQAVELWFAPADALNPHIMSNGSTWGTNGQREVVYSGTGNLYYSFLLIAADVTLPASDPLWFPSITFKDIQVVFAVGAKLKIGAYRQFFSYNSTWSGSNTLGAPADLYGDDASFVFGSCTLSRLQIDRDPANIAGTGVGVSLNQGTYLDLGKDQILCDHAYYGLDCNVASLRLNSTTAGVSCKLARTVAGGGMIAVNATFRNTDMYLITSNGAAATTLLDFGVATSVVSAFGLTIMPSLNVASPAALTTGFAALNTVPGPWGISVYTGNIGGVLLFSTGILINEYAQMLTYAVDTSNAVFPGFLTPVQVSGIYNARSVTVTVKKVAAIAAGGEAGVSLEVETAYLSGLYREVAATRTGNGAVRTDYDTLTYEVRGGLRYQFRNVSGAGGVATVEPINAANGATGYGYTDH